MALFGEKQLKDLYHNIRQAVQGGTKILYNRTIVRPIRRTSQDIQKWRNAMQTAEGYSQQRKELFDLYDDILLDGHLRAVTERRIENICNTDLVFVRKNGKVVEEITDLIETSYFEKLLTEIMNSKFWGHSLIELLFPAFGEDKKGQTLLIPRRNVKPRWGIVTKEYWDMKGADYRKPPFDKKIIEVGDPESLGIFLAVAQYVIYKRGDFGDWAEFATLFGIPFRHAKYNNEQSRAEIEKGLKEAGAAGYLITRQDAEISIIHGNGSGNGHEVFRTLRMACNEEISLAVLGNTMTTTEARNSGYAQSKTHSETENKKLLSDKRFVLRVLNEQLIPYLQRMGYPVADGKFQFQDEQHIPLETRIDIDLKVSEKVPVGDSYWYETYGIPKPKKSELPKDDNPDDKGEGKTDNEPAPSKKKSRRELNLNEFYGFHDATCGCGGCLNLTDQPVPKFRRISSTIETALIDQIRKGNFDLNESLHRAYYQRFREFARSGFSRSLSAPDSFDDFILQEGIKRNLNEFAAGKQHSLIQELAAHYRANPKTFAEKAKTVFNRYHKSYFEAELLTIEGRASLAGQWEEILKGQDLYPNLEFQTVGDDRVRQAHRSLDGAIYPINDSFWDTHLPPLDWRCRCIVLATDKAENQKAVQKISRGFGANPYKVKRLIEPNHPYFELGDSDFLTVAENFRAAIEMAGIQKAAKKANGLKLQNKSVTVTDSDLNNILNSETLHPDTRNAILAALAVALENLIAAGTETGTGYKIFQLTVLDAVYQFFFKAGDELALKKLTAT